MRKLLTIIFEGTLTNIKRILFASDRVTDMKMRNKILEGRVQPTEKVAEKACIGCGGCSNACPTQAITMVELNRPVRIMEGLEKTEQPELDSLKCIHCYYCHDFCPLYALFGEAGTIHPNNVGNVEIELKNLMKRPYKISDDKIAFISQFLSDKTIIEKGIPNNKKNNKSD